MSLYHFLWYIQRHFLSIDLIYPEVYLNDLNEIKSIVIIYSISGFSNRKCETNDRKFVIFHCDNESIDLLESMIKQCFPLNKSNKFYITANGKRFLPMIKQFQEENCLEIEYAYLMEIDQSTLEKSKSKLKNLPHGLNINFIIIIIYFSSNRY